MPEALTIRPEEKKIQFQEGKVSYRKTFGWGIRSEHSQAIDQFEEIYKDLNEEEKQTKLSKILLAAFSIDGYYKKLAGEIASIDQETGEVSIRLLGIWEQAGKDELQIKYNEIIDRIRQTPSIKTSVGTYIKDGNSTNGTYRDMSLRSTANKTQVGELVLFGLYQQGLSLNGEISVKWVQDQRFLKPPAEGFPKLPLESSGEQ